MVVTFSQIVKSSYNSRHQKELYRVLRAEGLHQRLKTVTDDYYKVCEINPTNENLQHFEKMVLEIMTIITLWFRSQPTESRCKPTSRLIMQLGYKLVKQAVVQAHKHTDTYLCLVGELIEKESLSIEWKHFIMNFFEADILYPATAKFKGISKKKSEKLPDPLVHLQWHRFKTDKQNQIKQAVFGNDVCYVLPGVRTPNKIDMLFRPGCLSYNIIVPAEHLRAFLALFRILHGSGRISCCQNRGFFKFLQAHIAVPENEKHIQRSDFYKVDYETRKNPKLEAEIRHILHALLEKYLPDESSTDGNL
jgi:hypothetical protein